jgi:hypothetical protein
VKNILVIDPNKTILNLFCKPMNNMFPNALIHATQSGEEALKLISAVSQREYGSSTCQHRNYDLIVVEQRLLHPQQQQQQQKPQQQ